MQPEIGGLETLQTHREKKVKPADQELSGAQLYIADTARSKTTGPKAGNCAIIHCRHRDKEDQQTEGWQLCNYSLQNLK